MLWNVKLVATSAETTQPLPGISILEASEQGRQLAVTDESGTATVSLEVDPGAGNALGISAIPFSVQGNTVTIYNHEVYQRLISGLPLFPDTQYQWNVKYTITDGDGGPVTGISAIDPLTGAVLASNPNVTITLAPDETAFAVGGVQAGSLPEVTVKTREYTFDGFYPEVANPWTVNVMPAGQAVDINFSLGGDQGMNIFYSRPQSEPYLPRGVPAENQITHTTAPGRSSLSYSSTTQTYTYVWQTSPYWKGTYHRFYLGLNDKIEPPGLNQQKEHLALFKFT
jgi:hypothetical protein